MHTDTALTAAQARKLLEIARKHNKNCYVKCHDKSVRAEPGKAQLIRVINDHRVEVKPFKHKHTEVVDLSCVQPWKSGNDFDFSEIFNMPAVNFVGGLGPAVKTPLIRTGKFYVISRKMKMIWGGSERGWVNKIEIAAKYDIDHHAARAVGKINKIPMSSDAEVVTEQQAKDFLGLQMGADVAETLERTTVSAMPSNTLPPMSQTPLSIARHSHAATPSSFVPPAPEAPKSTISVDTSSLLGMDLAAIMEDDSGDELRRLLSERKQAAIEFTRAKEFFENAATKLKEWNDKYNAFIAGQSFVPKGLTPSNEGGSKGKGKGFKIQNRGLKRAMYIAMSGVEPMTAEAVLHKIKAAMPNAELINVSQTLLAMKYEAGAERDEATKKWHLTEEGQKKAKQQMAESE